MRIYNSKTGKFEEIDSTIETIKPIQNNNKNSKKSNFKIDLVKKSNVFDDGYQFGDIAKTVGSTVGDLGTAGVKGIFKFGENLGDLGQYGVAQVANFVGADKTANSIRKNAMFDSTETIFNPIQKKLKDNSIAGKTTREVAQGVGNVVAMANGGALLPKAVSSINIGKLAMPTTSLISGLGSGITEAYNNGATDGQAWAYGGMSGTVEGLSEGMFGGLGGKFEKVFGPGALDDTVIKGITKNISNKVFKTIAQSGLKATGEGFEEVVSGLGSAVAKKLTYMNDTDFSELIKNENLMEQFIMGTITSAVMQTPGTVSSIKTGNNYINNQNNEDIIAKPINTTDFNKMSSNLNQTSQGKVFAPLAPNSSQNVLNDEDITKQNIIENDNIESQKDNNVFNLSDNQLNSNLDNQQLNNNFEYEKTTNEKVNSFYESARQYLNNSEESKNFTDVCKNVIEDRGTNIVFDPNIGENVNGKYDKSTDTITLNPNSKRAAEFVLTHELTHSIINNDLNDFITNYISNNETLKEASQSLLKQYNKSEIDEEILADVSGQLFGYQDFINNLSMQKPSVFKQIYNKVIELANKFTGGKNEDLFIKDLKNKWENAYRNIDANNDTNLKNETKNSKGKLNNGEDVVISDDINGSHPLKNEVEQSLKNNIGIKYINQNNNKEISIENKDIKKYLNDGYNNQKNNRLKKRIAGNYGEILEMSKINLSESKDNYKGSSRGKEGFDYYNVNLAYPIKNSNKEIIDYKYYEARLIVRKESNGHFAYDLDNFIQKKETVLDKTSLSIMADESAHGSLMSNNISQSNNDVKSDISTKYSMQEKNNNTQELDNSSFSLNENALEQRVSVDKLLDTQDFIEEIKSVGAKVDDNGYVTLYHATTKENANNIYKTGKMTGKEDGIFFSTSKNAQQSEGRGDSTLEFKIPAEKLVLDDIFSDNADVKIKLNKAGEYVDVSQYISNKNFTYDLQSIKEKQLEIVNKYNPVGNDVATWIRNVKDIKTFEETLQDSDYKEYYEAGEDFDETYSADMAREALEKGKITVYSSYPINQGIFVTPSKMEAESYSGNGKVYSKEVSLKDVAWIDPTQGQYAKVENTKNSKTNQNWQEYLEENYKNDGKRTDFKEMTKQIPVEAKLNLEKDTSKKVMNPNEISQLTKEDANTTPKAPLVKIKTGEGKSSHYNNLTVKSKFLNEQSVEAISKEPGVEFYEKTTNKDSLNQAKKQLDEGGKAENNRWFNLDKTKATHVDVAEGWILMKQYQDNGDYDSVVQVAKKMRDIGTATGQTLQVYAIMERLSPEGMVKYAQSELSEAYDNMIKNKTKEWIDSHKSDFDLSPAETKYIMETMEDISKMKDGYEKKVELAKIQSLMTNKLPPQQGAGIKAWMRISMLFNPKTQVRNVMGNAVIAPVNTVGDFFASGVDKMISKKTGVRTTGNTNLKAYSKGFKTGLYQSYNDFKLGINTRSIEGNRFEIGEGKSFNDKKIVGKTLNRVDNLLSFMLDGGDRGFYEASFNNSLDNQLVLNNTTEVTQEMIDIATSEALQRTWQDNNEYTKFVLNVRKGLNNINVKGYGLGDVLIPFAKTPANLTKAIVDYSPLGMINTVKSGIELNRSLSNGQFTPQMQHKFIQNLGKATAGSMLYILGYALAKAKITSGESDEDKDVANFMKNTLGTSSYSIKIGNKTFTYDWAQPVAAPFAIMSDLVSKEKEDASLVEKALSSLDTAGNILLEQSFLESLNTVFNNNDGIATGIQEAIFDLPGRAIPTLMKQITDLTDGTQRQQFVYGKPVETAVNKVKAKIPGLSQSLAPTVDTLGREVQKYGGKNNLFNVFLNPANVNTENISKSAQEIYRVYQETGDTTVMPRVSPYYINTSNGEKVILTNEQKSQFQKISGNIIDGEISKLLKDSTYQNLSEEDKASIINNIVNYSYNKARYDVLNMQMSPQYNKVNEYVQSGGSVSDYYINKTEIDYSLENKSKYDLMKQFNIKYNNYTEYQKAISDIKERYSSTNDRKNAVFTYINSLPYSKYQKLMLYKTIGGYSITEYKNEMFNYINGLNISKSEKENMWNQLYG